MNCTSKSALLAVLAWGLSSCANKEPSPAEIDQAMGEAFMQKLRDKDQLERDFRAGKLEGDWAYARDRDEISGTVIHKARLKSINDTYFQSPYGESKLNLILRDDPNQGQDLLFTIDDGQFICGVYDCTGRINIDGQTERLELVEPADGSSDILFAKYPDVLIGKIRSSDRVVVELTFFQEGNRHFKFATKGLEWGQ